MRVPLCGGASIYIVSMLSEKILPSLALRMRLSPKEPCHWKMINHLFRTVKDAEIT